MHVCKIKAESTTPPPNITTTTTTTPLYLQLCPADGQADEGPPDEGGEGEGHEDAVPGRHAWILW